MNLAELAKKIFEEDKVQEDCTTRALTSLIKTEKYFAIIAKQNGVFSGKSWLDAVESLSALKFEFRLPDGQKFLEGEAVIKGRGPVSDILSLERSILNVLQHTCGVSSKTSLYLSIIQEEAKKKNLYPNKIPGLYHTRKTLPLLRDLQINAFLAGGGQLHRRDLSSRLMFKDNHKQLIQSSGMSYGQYLNKVLTSDQLQTALVEVDNIHEAMELYEIGIRNYLLDNFDPIDVQTAAAFLRNSVIEVSGGINGDNIRSYVLPGVDRISIGALTHSVQALDLSLELYGV